MIHNLREWIWNSNVDREQSYFNMLCWDELYISRLIRKWLSQGMIILKRDINTIKNMLYKHQSSELPGRPEKLTKAFPSLGERWVSVKGNHAGRAIERLDVNTRQHSARGWWTAVSWVLYELIKWWGLIHWDCICSYFEPFTEIANWFRRWQSIFTE